MIRLKHRSSDSRTRRPCRRRGLLTWWTAGLTCWIAAGPPNARAEPPHTLAITEVRIVAGDGQIIEQGTILIDQGRIVAVGQDVAVPAYAEVVEAAGHVAYPGFIDAHGHLGIPEQKRSEEERHRLEDERPDPKEGPLAETRAANRRGIRADARAEILYAPSSEGLEKHREAGFTTALVAPRSGVLAGSSMLVNLSKAPMRRAILSTDVAQHAGFVTGEPGSYPEALLGRIAQFRQVMSDARWYAQARKYAARHPRTAERPPFDRALESLQPVLRGQIPVIFEANTADEIRRALDLAEEFNVNVIISGGAEAWRLVDRLKARRVPQIISLKFPEEPDYGKKDSKRQSESPATQPASQPSTQPA
ncbi:MAG: amidohydrolase family protein, partial [Planctomycetota bacterium]